MTKSAFFAFSVMCLAISLVACTSRLTSESLSNIKTGMTSSEVVTLLGKPTETESQSALGISGATYIYRSDKSEVKIVFLNDKVTAVQSHLQ